MSSTRYSLSNPLPFSCPNYLIVLKDYRTFQTASDPTFPTAQALPQPPPFSHRKLTYRSSGVQIPTPHAFDLKKETSISLHKQLQLLTGQWVTKVMSSVASVLSGLTTRFLTSGLHSGDSDAAQVV
ncbi:hypothetical protein PoB_006913200 [Plakobranchus ocellatus]|uniref:Uncharacterized protein n=1 Tax=Plakobranchus ocellatus TaxID=259542 RepID=A0AAV4DEG1_9GAST|nr:hypothetical protein PoB_006913200 [Plakobranchus ocellatus]